MTENLYFEFERAQLKGIKKSMRGQFCILVLNVCWAVIELHLGLKSYSPIELTCVGMMCMNAIWSLFFLIDNYNDYKQSKHMINYYREREAEGNFDRLCHSLKHMKSFYEKKVAEMTPSKSND